MECFTLIYKVAYRCFPKIVKVDITRHKNVMGIVFSIKYFVSIISS